MIKRLSLGLVILAVSIACGTSPTSPSPVANTPPPPVAATPQVVSLSITASRDVVQVHFTSVLQAIANYDDGSSAPITPRWETVYGPVTLLGNGPVALVTGQAPGTGVITAHAAGLSTTKLITVAWPK